MTRAVTLKPRRCMSWFKQPPRFLNCLRPSGCGCIGADVGRAIGGFCELSVLGRGGGVRTDDGGDRHHSCLCLPLRHRGRALSGGRRNLGAAESRHPPFDLPGLAQQVLHSRHRRLRRAHRCRHLVHHRVAQSGRDRGAHSQLRVGMGHRVDLLRRRDPRGDPLFLRLEIHVGAQPPGDRLDLLRRGVAFARGHRRHPELHADARRLAPDRRLLAGLFRTRPTRRRSSSAPASA